MAFRVALAPREDLPQHVRVNLTATDGLGTSGIYHYPAMNMRCLQKPFQHVVRGTRNTVFSKSIGTNRPRLGV